MDMTTFPSQRLRFSSFEFDRFPKGRCRAWVALEQADGTRVEEAVEGIGTANSASELRCAAQATIEGLAKIAGPAFHIDLLGVKAIRAFETSVVIVALSVQENDRMQRLVGCVLAGDDPERGAALAVLDATNRYLAQVLCEL